MNATIFHVVLLKKIHPPQRIHNLTTKHHKNNGTYVSSSCYFAKKCIDSHKHIHNIKKQHNHNACHDISCCSSENMHQTQKNIHDFTTQHQKQHEKNKQCLHVVVAQNAHKQLQHINYCSTYFTTE